MVAFFERICMLRRIAFSLILLFPLALQAIVYTPTTLPNPKQRGQEYYVANPDHILNADDEAYLNHCAAMLEQKTQVEMCVAALQSIGNADCFYFSYELFQRWGIGRKGKNTGVLIVFVLDSHDIRIMTGVGMEGVLTDAKCSEIIRKDMTPSFREGLYGEGLCLGALRIYEVCTNGTAPEELLNMQSVTNRGKYDQPAEDEDKSWLGFVVLFVVLTIILIVIWKSRGSSGSGGSFGSSGSGRYYGGGYGGSSYGGFGGGGFGGGSFGGGSTMGGGAGGKW